MPCFGNCGKLVGRHDEGVIEDVGRHAVQRQLTITVCRESVDVVARPAAIGRLVFEDQVLTRRTRRLHDCHMLDQPLAFVAALRMLLDGWMRSESGEGSS